MLKNNVLFFNILSEFAQSFVLSVSKLLNARCKKTILAAVHATEERLIDLGIWHKYKISAHLAFSYTKRELFALQRLVAIN